MRILQNLDEMKAYVNTTTLRVWKVSGRNRLVFEVGDWVATSIEANLEVVVVVGVTIAVAVGVDECGCGRHCVRRRVVEQLDVHEQIERVTRHGPSSRKDYI